MDDPNLKSIGRPPAEETAPAGPGWLYWCLALWCFASILFFQADDYLALLPGYDKFWDGPFGWVAVLFVLGLPAGWLACWLDAGKT